MAGDDVTVDDVKLDLAAIRAASLKAARDYRRYLRDAEIAGLPEVAYFVRLLAEEDAARAAHCRGLLRRLGSKDTTRSAVDQPESADAGRLDLEYPGPSREGHPRPGPRRGLTA